jgi:hypothetical protein
MLGNKGYGHILVIFNSYCFSTAAMRTRTLLVVMLSRAVRVLFYFRTVTIRSLVPTRLSAQRVPGGNVVGA